MLIVVFQCAFMGPVLTTFLNYTEVTEIFNLVFKYGVWGSNICKLCIGDRSELQTPCCTVSTP